jgi:hypothetical protein
MAAGLGFKDFTTGEVLTAADVDGYLMQGVWVFASAAARTSAVASPQEGNMSFLKDTNSLEYYSGAAWVAVAGGGGTTFVGCSLTDVSGAITLTNNTLTAITWDTENIDTDAFHSTSTNPSRITIPTGKGGKYLISAKLAYNSNATGERAVQIYKNGSIVLQMNVKNGLTGTFFTPTNTGVFSAVATDYFEVYGFQNSGGDLAIQPGSAGETLQFSATYLGA